MQRSCHVQTTVTIVNSIKQNSQETIRRYEIGPKICSGGTLATRWNCIKLDPLSNNLFWSPWCWVGGAVSFLVVGTIGKEEDHHGVSSGWSSIWFHLNTSLSSTADPNYISGLAILANSLLFSVKTILVGLWSNRISSVEITLLLLADIVLQHRALFQF